MPRTIIGDFDFRYQSSTFRNVCCPVNGPAFFGIFDFKIRPGEIRDVSEAASSHATFFECGMAREHVANVLEVFRVIRLNQPPAIGNGARVRPASAKSSCTRRTFYGVAFWAMGPGGTGATP
jgi:hypothetical protein